jgi:hypothetical protein
MGFCGALLATTSLGAETNQKTQLKRGALEGVWSFQSVRVPISNKVIAGRTGYLIFSKHYFVVVITPDKRKAHAPEEDLSSLPKEDLVEMLQLTAGAGKYEVIGTTLHIETLAHLRAESVGTKNTEEMTLRNDTLTLTYPTLVTTSMYSKGDIIEATFKRVE